MVEQKSTKIQLSILNDLKPSQEDINRYKKRKLIVEKDIRPKSW